MIKACLKKQLVTSDGLMNLNVSFEIGQGELVTLFGPSGAGKTTILRMLAGLCSPDEGTIEVQGKIWFDHKRKINLLPQQRSTGFVFQDYTLFPHMSVYENLKFALTNSKEEILIDELLAFTHLTELKDRHPDQLSGGQKQRVALIRAIVRKPKILLLDEPLAAVDLSMRLKLQDEMIKLCRRFRTSTIFVTHDLAEVFKLSQRVLVLEEGKIVKSGVPSEIFVQNNLSGKFRFIGEILGIKKEGVVNILSILIGNNLTKVIATDEELEDLQIGSKVIVASKAFNPIILKYTL